MLLTIDKFGKRLSLVYSKSKSHYEGLKSNRLLLNPDKVQLVSYFSDGTPILHPIKRVPKKSSLQAADNKAVPRVI